MTAFARHGKGGYLVYKYLGAGSSANTSKYEITVVHYVNCNETEFELGSVYVGVFDGASNNLISTFNIPRSGQRYIQKQQFDGCISPKPEVCFFLAFYVTTIELPNSNAGYILAEQECCRAEGLANIINSGQIGTTNFNSIPGIINGIDYHTNSSPDVVIKDTAVICHGSPFELEFGTSDPDNDRLTYSFCSATIGGTRGDRQPNPPSRPPYMSVDYSSPYSGESPLGSKVSIDAKTGLIKGIAPAKTGNYTIAVCITEYRDGVTIAVTKKEILITVADCSLSAASLKPVYTNCDSYSFTFENESFASDVSSYLWDFGTTVNDASLLTQPTPSFTYSDTGIYRIKLKVTSGSNCSDSATSLLKIYPGFSAGFTVNGSCYQSPFLFTDTSYTKYGNINYYRWDFGDTNASADTSRLANPAYQYANAGNVTVTQIVGSDKGCLDTATKTVAVNNKPQIILPFKDTLICRDDRLPILAQSSGTIFNWAPAYNISNTTVVDPVVYPFDTTAYTLIVKDKQCIDTVKLIVNVIDSVTLRLPAELKLCATDSVQLQPVSNALYYAWSETNGIQTLDNNTAKTPKAAPLQNTTYFVTASVGHCSAATGTDVLVSPYPTATVSEGSSICYGNTIRLEATTTAANYLWSPAASLNGANTLHPLAGPQQTTAYVLTISDTFYCEKSVTDTVLVQVIPLPVVDAGNDTIAVVGQPLQLAAVANEEAAFQWSPGAGFYDNNVYDPVITIRNATPDSLTFYVTAKTAQGCLATDSVRVKIYKSIPDMFIPSAFTPDGDGRNDIFRPINAGIAKLSFFRVYSRLGELMFETTKDGEGWDGVYKGERQPAGTYVFAAEGTDYTGRRIVKRGTVVLIR